MKKWQRLPITISLGKTLLNGQCFGWRASNNAFIGVVGRTVVSLRHQQPHSDAGASVVEYLQHNSEAAAADDVAKRLLAYFQPSMLGMTSTWAAADARMKAIATALQGMVVLRQPPLECLISFICSSNNNIARITMMLSKLRTMFGDYLCTVDGVAYHAFPTVEQLAAIPEQALRDLGFGYRAPYVVATAATLRERGGEEYLLSLRGKPRLEVQAALMTFAGVGRKVADCVALFSLDAADAVPVDTHVYTLARRYYDPSLPAGSSGGTGSSKGPTMNAVLYERVGNLFRSRFGSHAGWAHSMLFAAELPAFSKYLEAVPGAPAAAAGVAGAASAPSTRKASTSASASATAAPSSASASAASKTESTVAHPSAAAACASASGSADQTLTPPDAAAPVASASSSELAQTPARRNPSRGAAVPLPVSPLLTAGLYLPKQHYQTTPASAFSSSASTSGGSAFGYGDADEASSAYSGPSPAPFLAGAASASASASAGAKRRLPEAAAAAAAPPTATGGTSDTAAAGRRAASLRRRTDPIQ